MQIQGQRLAALLPQPVGGAVSLQGVEAFEVKKGLGESGRRRVALANRSNVRAHGLPDPGIFVHRFRDQFAHQHGGQHRAFQLARQLEGEGVFQRLVVQHRSVKKACQHRFPRGGRRDFLANALPEGIDRRFGELGWD